MLILYMYRLQLQTEFVLAHHKTLTIARCLPHICRIPLITTQNQSATDSKLVGNTSPIEPI